MQAIWSNRGGGQAIIAGVAIICIAFAAYFIFKGGESKKEGAFGDLFYYCTNCQKEFTSDSHVPPIKCPFCGQVTGVIARKYKCNDCNTEFIGYLQKYDPQTKMLIERRMRGEKVPDEQIKSILVSEPGEEDWIDASLPEGIELMDNVTCPNCGGTNLEPIFPQKKK